MSVAAINSLVDSASAWNDPKHEGAGPRELNLSVLARTQPMQPEFLLQDMIPQGEITLLGGNGGTGKSWIALMLAVCIAMGLPFFGIPCKRRRSAYVSFEDCEAVLHWRLSRICYALNIEMSSLIRWLQLFDGASSPDSWFTRGEHGEVGLTPQFELMRQRLNDAQFIVVDGSSDTYAGNENDRAMVKAFLRGLRTMIPPEGALLLLAHVDKNSAKVGASSLGFSGSTGWNNGVRARLFLFPETTGDDDSAPTGNVRLEVRKSNLGAVGAGLTLRYDPDSNVFKRVDSLLQKGERVDELEGVLKVLRLAYDAGNPIPAATAGSRTAHKVAGSYDEFPSTLSGKAGRGRFNALIERLRASGRVKVELVTKTTRHKAEVLRVVY